MTDKAKEYLQKLTKKGNTPLYPFDVIESKVNLLMTDIKVLNENPEIFAEEYRKVFEELGSRMGDHLSFYVLQEFQDFYRIAHIRFKGKIDFPETAEQIRNLRGINTAHIKAESVSEIAQECIELQEKYGFDRICREWVEFRVKLYSKFKSGELKLK